ncbi:MAG: sigma-70 family RNA polymerase sigma factor [Bacillota bacterium]|nr:sigma-70 family RNA polymerase sigma factor [Bacillota bacterium]
MQCAIREALTPRQRQLVQMYYLRQMPMQTIACELGVAPSTVCRTLARARKRLEQCLKHGGRSFMYLLDN